MMCLTRDRLEDTLTKEYLSSKDDNRGVPMSSDEVQIRRHRPTHQIPSICLPVRGKDMDFASPLERSYTYSWTFDIVDSCW